MFAKVFQQILDSSLAEDWQVRVVFEDLLKLATPSGVVDMTRESIARRTNVPIDVVKRGIAHLESPDATSRTPDHEGRRIIRLDEHRDWGWRIVNYLKYRQSATKEMLRMGDAERKKEARRLKGFPHTPSETEGKKKSTEEDMSHDSPDMSGQIHQITFKKPSLEEVKLACAKAGIRESDGDWFFHKCEGNGWTNNGKPIKRWFSTIRAWQLAGYLPSQKTLPIPKRNTSLNV